MATIRIIAEDKAQRRQVKPVSGTALRADGCRPESAPTALARSTSLLMRYCCRHGDAVLTRRIPTGSPLWSKA